MPQKPIRILQIGMSDNYGGTESVVYGIYERLDRSAVQFDFLNVYGHPLAKQSHLEELGAHIYNLLLKRREGYFKYIKGIKSFYREHASEFDAVVANVQCLDQIAMLKYAKKFGIKKRVVYAHNSGNGIAPSRFAKIAIWWNKLFSHHYVTDYVGVSENASKWSFSHRDALKAKTILSGVDSEAFSFDEGKRDRFRAAYGIPNDAFLVGSAGRFDPQKNQMFLLDIFKEISIMNPEAKFVLAGFGPLEKEIRSRISALALQDKVLLLVGVSDLRSLYSALDVFVFPSLFEGMGMVLIEAQCAGLTCFASAKTIPSEAKILPSFHFVSLSESPLNWASAVAEASAPLDRHEAYLEVKKAGRDLNETIKEYQGLFQ